MATTAVIDQNIDLPQPATGQIGWATLTAANTNKDGTGTVATILTGATNGSQPHVLKFRPLGTNVATVARVFVNNGGATSTAANNTLFQEVTLPETTLTEVEGQLEYYADLRGLPPSSWPPTGRSARLPSMPSPNAMHRARCRASPARARSPSMSIRR